MRWRAGDLIGHLTERCHVIQNPEGASLGRHDQILAPEGLKGNYANCKRVFASIANKVTRYEPGKEVAPGIVSWAAYGHTPGHTGFTVSSGDKALLMGSDNKGYFLRVGDEVYDGTIIAIDSRLGSVTFRQQIDDPRMIKPYRDIVKRLVPLEDEESGDE